MSPRAARGRKPRRCGWSKGLATLIKGEKPPLVSKSGCGLGQGHQSRLLERQRRPRVLKAAQRLFFGSAWLMLVIQAAVVASRSKDPTGC
jgi:hypothetical protein